MRILFLHDNFPAQFGAFGQYLVREGWEAWFGTQRAGAALPGLKVFNYAPHRPPAKGVHPYAAGFERAVLAGQAVAREAIALKAKGLNPDFVMAHSGWGPGVYAKDIWPDAKYVGYFEWFYEPEGPDTAHLGGANRTLDDRLQSRTRNAAILMDLAQCDGAICPTRFQAARFPPSLRDKLAVMHDGVDTEYYAPTAELPKPLPGVDLSRASEFVTYVARGMEPYRGFMEFMAALKLVFDARPGAHAIVVGDDRVAYGKALPEGDSYKRRAMREIELDWSRVHFTGLLPRSDYRSVLRRASVHVYLTIPFVLSWSMMEAMSAGCPIVAADVEPVREIVGGDGDAVALAPLDAPAEIARVIIELLGDRARATALGARARAAILERYAARDLYRRKRDWLLAL